MYEKFNNSLRPKYSLTMMAARAGSVILLLYILNQQSKALTQVQWTTVKGQKYDTYQELLDQISKEDCILACTMVSDVFQIRMTYLFNSPIARNLGVKHWCLRNVWIQPQNCQIVD